MSLTGQSPSDTELTDHIRNRQVMDGLLTCTDGRYLLTEEGEKMVRKELKRYDMRPGMMMLIQQKILEACEIEVY